VNVESVQAAQLRQKPGTGSGAGPGGGTVVDPIRVCQRRALLKYIEDTNFCLQIENPVVRQGCFTIAIRDLRDALNACLP
jgi:hypothetical protein